MEATLLRLGQFRLEHAPSLFQGFRLSFRRGDDVLRERCEQLLRLLVSVHRKHPMEVLWVEVLEHRIKRRTFEQQRLNRYANGRDDRLQLLGDAAWVSQVGNDETGHTGQQCDGLSNVPPGRNLKVEEDRQVVTLAQFLT